MGSKTHKPEREMRLLPLTAKLLLLSVLEIVPAAARAKDQRCFIQKYCWPS